MKPIKVSTASDKEYKRTTELLRKANEGDHEACKQFYADLDAKGTAKKLIAMFTDTPDVLCSAAEKPIAAEAFRRKIEEIKQDLGWQTASTLERLLIERIALCWFHLHRIEVSFVQQMRESISLEKSTYLQKSLDRAENRYQAAVRSLAILRRLQIPPTLINVADKQINLLQMGQGTPLLTNSPLSLEDCKEMQENATLPKNAG